MSLILNRGKHEVPVKTWNSGTVFFGDHELELPDFLDAVMYVLTNSDLSGPHDPRLAFIDQVKKLEQVDGFGAAWGHKTKRLKDPAA